MTISFYTYMIKRKFSSKILGYIIKFFGAVFIVFSIFLMSVYIHLISALFITLSIVEDYELNDSGCYRIRRLEENLYEEYLPKDYQKDDVITYQWNQSREDNYQGQFNFYYSITRDSISKGSMLLYMILLLAIGVLGDAVSSAVQSLFALFK